MNISSTRSFYKYVLRQVAKLPEGVQNYYKHFVRQVSLVSVYFFIIFKPIKTLSFLFNFSNSIAIQMK